MEDQSILPDTIEALRKLSEDARLRPQERASIEKEMQDIEEFTAKLENGRVEIAAFGEVGSGKSALLNALAGEQVFAVSAEHGSTDKVSKAGFKNTRLILVDTPGINEAAGELRGKLAEETVRYTDLVLFVADGDLNRVEVDALKELCDLHKPMLLVINKADLLGPAQVKEISESILRKVGHRIGAADIVFAAAAPRETEREIHKADGNVEIVRYQPKPKIDMLEKRMLEVLDREGKAIIALNASLFATDVSEQISALKQHVRGKEVRRLIYYFMLGKALVVGANPVPVFDVLAGMASDALYGTEDRRHLRYRFFAEECARHGAGNPARLGADGRGRIRIACRSRPLAHRHIRHQHGTHRGAAGARRGLEHVRGRQCGERLFPRRRLGRPLCQGDRAGDPHRRGNAEDQHPRADPRSVESQVRALIRDIVGWLEPARLARNGRPDDGPAKPIAGLPRTDWWVSLRLNPLCA